NAHEYSNRKNTQCFFEWNPAGKYSTKNSTECSHSHQDRCLVEPVSEMACTPFNYDQLQRGASTPEQGGDRQGNLPQSVAPEDLHIAPERADELGGVFLLLWILDAGFWNQQVADCRSHID